MLSNCKHCYAKSKENAEHINHDYAKVDKMLMINESVDSKVRNKHNGPFPILHVHKNGAVRIKHGGISDELILGDFRLTLSVTNEIHYMRPFAHIWMGVINYDLKTWGHIVVIKFVFIIYVLLCIQLYFDNICLQLWLSIPQWPFLFLDLIFFSNASATLNITLPIGGQVCAGLASRLV